MRRIPAAHHTTVRDDGGQALVEFALIVPLFLFLVIGCIEFSFLLNSRNTVTHAARAASQRAAEGGSQAGTDCAVLDVIESSIVSPADSIRVTRVLVYWSDANGNQIGSAYNEYDRSGSTTCTYGDGTTLTVPYALIVAGYPEDQRCDVLAGCGGGHTALDTVAVDITYQHRWLTSFARLTGGSGVTFSIVTATRVEPQK